MSSVRSMYVSTLAIVPVLRGANTCYKTKQFDIIPHQPQYYAWVVSVFVLVMLLIDIYCIKSSPSAGYDGGKESAEHACITVKL